MISTFPAIYRPEGITHYTEGVPIGISVYFLKAFASIASLTFVINVMLNQRNFLYKITAIFTTPSLAPLTIQLNQRRKSIYRYINLLNSLITYGSYFIDIDRGTIGFRMIQTKT
jgi:hypothetical protein